SVYSAVKEALTASQRKRRRGAQKIYRSVLFGGREEKKLAHFAGHIADDGALLRPCKCLVHTGAFQNPKSAHVFLGLGVRPVSNGHLAVGMLSQRLGAGWRGNATGEFPDAGSNHFAVERVDFFHHLFGHGGRVKVVGHVVTNQILWHEFFSLFFNYLFSDDSLPVHSGTVAHRSFAL